MHVLGSVQNPLTYNKDPIIDKDPLFDTHFCICCYHSNSIGLNPDDSYFKQSQAKMNSQAKRNSHKLSSTLCSPY